MKKARRCEGGHVTRLVGIDKVLVSKPIREFPLTLLLGLSLNYNCIQNSTKVSFPLERNILDEESGLILCCIYFWGYDEYYKTVTYT